jgi:hypothetical protein
MEAYGAAWREHGTARARNLGDVTAKEQTPDPRVPNRAFVQLPECYFQLDDQEAAPIDEAIADAILEQLGISDVEC